VSDSYLKCGHPSGCEKERTDGFGYIFSGRVKREKYCAACERGGWVYCSEGLPPFKTSVIVVLQQDKVQHIEPGWLDDAAIWCIEDTDMELETCGWRVYAWMYWPDPPPPEGE